MTKRIRQFLLPAVFLASAIASGAVSAASGDWPTKPLKIVVVATPGGFPDIVARLIAPHLSSALGQSVVVENRPGAGGNIATAYVARAPADGHTLLLTGNNHATNQTLLPDPGFDYVKDLAPVSGVAETAIVLISRPNFPPSDLAAVAALAKKGGKPVSFAVTAIGTPGWLASRQYVNLTGEGFTLVPYQGIAPAMNDVLSGTVDLMFASATGVAGLIQSGKVKALAVASPTGYPLLPDVKSSADSGEPRLEVRSWVGVMTTGGTPDAAVQRLSSEIRKIMALPEVRDTLKAQRTVAWGTTPEQLASRIRTEAETWAPLLKNAKSR